MGERLTDTEILVCLRESWGSLLCQQDIAVDDPLNLENDRKWEHFDNILSHLQPKIALHRYSQDRFLDDAKLNFTNHIISNFWGSLVQVMDEISPKEVNPKILCTELLKIASWLSIFRNISQKLTIPSSRADKTISVFYALFSRPYKKLYLKDIIGHIFDLYYSVSLDANNTSFVSEDLGNTSIDSDADILFTNQGHENHTLAGNLSVLSNTNLATSQHDLSTASTIQPTHYSTQIISALHQIGMSQAVLECFSTKTNEKIREIVKEKCEDVYDDPNLFENGVLEWVNSSVFPLLTYVLPKANEKELFSWKQSLESRSLLAYIELRISEIFNIMKDYPDSQPALLQLKDMMHNIDIRRRVKASLFESVVGRLLVQGASTEDILTLYINIIKATNYLDDYGTILEEVAPSIQEYLNCLYPASLLVHLQSLGLRNIIHK
eukprot:TRINITY_DN5845_c0_g1_i3.p1 TRINITY_DN5845_c0_g1~~TRINITY_DN5845_c0_g1_i3.p1  ORF type:complete len:437 (-),score=76.61 TRINITY_DN5845_c0_g1_i3:1822-3132(-)